MAFFKFRWPGGAEPQADSNKGARRSRAAAQAESIDDMRRRARHRLIGAAVLVLAGVVGFPLVFDTQPRPVAVDVAIDIPDRNKVAPLAVPGKGASQDEPRAKPEPAAAGLDAGEEVIGTSSRAEPAAQVEAKPEARTEPKPAPRPEPKAEPKPEPKVEHKPEPKPEPEKPAGPKVDVPTEQPGLSKTGASTAGMSIVFVLLALSGVAALSLRRRSAH